jgi:CheY-like chemotaxis protein
MTVTCRVPIKIRLLMVAPDTESLDLMQSLLNAAQTLVPLNVEVNRAWSHMELLWRARANLDDLIFLDWQLAEAETPNLVRELTSINPKLRIIVLLPLKLRQYRQCLWDAGVCSSIPKENLDAEWLSSALCLISRAMERERRATITFDNAQPDLIAGTH